MKKGFMKKALGVVIAGAMMFSMVGCSSSSSSSSDEVTLPKSIEIQVPAAAGGGTDVMARALSSKVAEDAGISMSVVNNTDGSGVVAMEKVRTASSDGSTILQYHTTMLIKTATGIYEKSAAEDFTIIGVSQGTEKAQYVFVVSADSGYTTLEEFIEAAQTQEMKLGVETGGTSHIITGLFVKASGINARYVEAGSDTEKLTALVGNTIDGCMVNVNQAEQYVEAGKAIALAVVSNGEEGARSTVLPDVQSFQELGYDCTFALINIFAGPTDMDEDVAKLLYEYYAAAAASDEVNEVLEPAGMAMEFMDFEEGRELVATMQETINEIVEELGLNQ